MKISEAILLAILAIFSLVLLISSLEIPYGTDQTFGPGFVPLNLSVATLAVIAYVAIKAFGTARRRRDDADHAAGDQAKKTNAAAQAGVLAAAIAVVVLTTLAMEFVGVLPPVLVMMALLSWRFSGHSLVKSITVSLFSVAAIWLIFEVWLNIPLT